MFGKITAIVRDLSPGLRKILGNVGWLFAERLLTMVAAFSIGIYVIRYLGAENFGQLSYAASFVDIFSAIANLGLNGIIVRNIVREEKSTREILDTAFVLKLIASVVAIGLIAIANRQWNDQPTTREFVTIISISLVLTSFDTIEFWFESQVLSGVLAIFRSAQLLFGYLVKILFVVFSVPLMGFVWLILVERIIKASGMVWLYLKRQKSFFQGKVNWSLGLKMLEDSWPLILSSIMVMIYMKIDQIMLGNMIGDREVGNYAAAIKFSEVWYFIPVGVCSSVFPSILRAKQRSQKEYYARLQQLYDLMAWIAIAIAIPLTFLSTPLIVTLLGQEYAEAGKILPWHIWASPFVFLGVARHQWLLSENLSRLSFLSTALGAISNVGLNLWLIPRYQGVGAAVATMLSYGISSHVSCLLYPPMFTTGLMLTKALLIPFRFRQNILYFNKIKYLYCKIKPEIN